MEAKRSGSTAIGCGVGVVLGVLAALMVGGWLLARNSGARVMDVFRLALGKGPAQIDVSQPSVIRQIQQLERLETVVYSVEKLISGQHESPYLPKFLVGDRLLLIVHGE